MMWNKSEPVSIIEKRFTVEGTVSWKGMLLVKGTVKGKLLGDSMIITEEGAVYAETEVKRLSIGGVFEGIARASSGLTLLSTGNCKGKIICRDLVVEEGGILNAEVVCTLIQE